MRRLPDFLIIGAYKSGTTSLVEYLGQHSQVFLPWLQEPNYFAYAKDGSSRGAKPDVEWNSVYRRHRTTTRRQYEALFEEAPEGVVVGECSPEYMRSPHACGRILATVPHVKLVAILRNPVDRAHSDYQAFVRDSIEQEDFATAIQRPYGVEPGYQYVETGFYGKQLRPYYEAFPADQIRVLLTEDLQHNGVEVLRELCDWLNVDSDGFEPDLTLQKNISGRPGNLAVQTAYRLRRRLRPWLKPVVPDWAQRRADTLLASGLKREQIAPEVRAALTETYRDDIKLLEELTGRDLSGWLSAQHSS